MVKMIKAVAMRKEKCPQSGPNPWYTDMRLKTCVWRRLSLCAEKSSTKIKIHLGVPSALLRRIFLLCFSSLGGKWLFILLSDLKVWVPDILLSDLIFLVFDILVSSTIVVQRFLLCFFFFFFQKDKKNNGKSSQSSDRVIKATQLISTVHVGELWKSIALYLQSYSYDIAGLIIQTRTSQRFGCF